MVYELEALRGQFPDFALSAEFGRGSWRYLARSKRRGLNPWVVITRDLNELRTVLMQASPSRCATIGEPKSSHPHAQPVP